VRKGAVSGWEEFSRVALQAAYVIIIRYGTEDEETYVCRGIGSKVEEKLSKTMAKPRLPVRSAAFYTNSKFITLPGVR
jgi:hypothetical protein